MNEGRPYEPPRIEQMNAFATHAPLLAAMVARSTGPILEIGMGHYSTPLLHFMGMATGREVNSVDVNEAWCQFFAERFLGPLHSFACTRGIKPSEWLQTIPRKYGVAFIDHSPEGDRVPCIKLLRQHAEYIVVHDTDPDACSGGVYGWGNIFDTFKYRFDWNIYGNNTTIVSDTKEIGL